MARILIIHSGLNGISNACLEIAKRLRNDKHKVLVSDMLGDNDKVNYKSNSKINISPIRFEYQSDERRKELGRAEYFDLLIEELNYSGLDEILKSNQIDLILIDLELHEYIVYLKVQGFPFVLINVWFSIWQFGKNLPPFSTKVPKSTIQQNFLWTYSNLRGRLKTVLHSAKTKGISRRNFIVYLAKRLGFDNRQFISYHFPLPFSYRSLPTISTTHPDLEFGNNSLPNLSYVYPMICADRKELKSAKFSLEFDSILSKISNENKKLIVVTSSTMRNNKQSLSVLLNALTEIKDCISIVSLGHLFDEYKQFGDCPNVFVYRVIPQLLTFQHAHLSINHGGIHTINECIHYNLPMLVLSGRRFDQNGCAARIKNHGCGLAFFEKNISKSTIQKAILSLLLDTKYKQKINDLHDEYISAVNRQILENYIKSYLT